MNIISDKYINTYIYTDTIMFVNLADSSNDSTNESTLTVLNRDNIPVKNNKSEIEKRLNDILDMKFNFPYKKNLNVNIKKVVDIVCTRMIDGMKTSEIDEYCVKVCNELQVDHPDYEILAARLAISNHHKKTRGTFSDKMKMLYSRVTTEGKSAELLKPEFYNFVDKYQCYFNHLNQKNHCYCILQLKA